LCQSDFAGEPLFQHRNAAKWVLFGHNRAVPGFQQEAFCRAALAELARRWDGRIFHPPPRSARAQALERRLEGGRFRCLYVGSHQVAISLLSGHRIGEGRDVRLSVWHVEDGAEGPELVIGDHRDGNLRLSPAADGMWRGRMMFDERMPVELYPDDAAPISETAGPASFLHHWPAWRYEALEPDTARRKRTQGAGADSGQGRRAVPRSPFRAAASARLSQAAAVARLPGE